MKFLLELNLSLIFCQGSYSRLANLKNGKTRGFRKKIEITSQTWRFYTTSAQNCPSGWTKRVGFDDCYLVISSEKKTWDEAREACHELDGDLVSINEPGENEWILRQLSGVLSFFWIGLIDSTGSGHFVWSDGSAYDPTTAYWGSGEPPSEGQRTCAIIDSLLGDWSDSDCSKNENYICERSLTEPIKCAEDDGWRSSNNKCYKFIPNHLTWDGAQDHCKDFDANLVAIRNKDEQQIVNNFIEDYGRTVWIGLKDMDGDHVFDKWSTGDDLGYTNWDDKQPANFSRACGVVEDQGRDTGPWSTEDCYGVYPSICEKKEGMCYPGWKIHKGNCYQFVSNQKETWFGAKHICDGQGGFMLTVETKEEQDFIIQQLPKLQLSGSEDIWIGLSDWEDDGIIRWIDGTVVNTDTYFNFPNHQIPKNREDEVECGYVYVESPTGQWQYGDCFELYDYVCEIPEGAAIKPYDPSDSRGSCPAGWSYFDQYCYLFNDTDQNFQTGEAICEGYGGHLVSIHTVEEESFLSLRLSDFMSYWIGLNDIQTEGQWKYTDGTGLDFINWSDNEPNNAGEGEDCVEMRGYTWDRGMWNDVSCDISYLGIICKVDAAAVTSAPPTNPPNIGCFNGNGKAYRGHAQITIDGELCERWEDMTDQIINPITYPNAGLEQNYCRNPNNGPAPWCYVRLELGVGWKVCDIENCAPGVDCFEGDGYSYRGRDHITEDGDECLYWGQLSTYAYYRPANFPDAGLDHNYCRNPSGSRYGPWCYYNQTDFGSYRSKPCGVAHCNLTGCYEGNGESYRGSVSKTEGGITCLFWDNVTNVDVNPKNYPFAGLDHNYCRNPNGEDKPWCYISPMGDTAPCDVHQCSGEIGCYTYIGVDYRGKAHFTTAGVECLNWALFIDEFYPDSLDAFTQDSFSFLSGGSFKQINDIRQSQCAEYCLNTTDTYCKGFNYQRSADTCYLLEHDTSDESTSLSFFYDYYERNQTFGLEKNYCRNPTNAAAPWCYYSDPKTPSVTSWNFCAVPECNPEDPGCYDPIDRGASYRGTGHTTVNGHTCMAWSETNYPPEENPNKGLEANYCRNPRGYSGGPYCYYPGKYGPSFEYCNVPQCDVEQVCGEGWIEDPSSTYCYQIVTNQASTYDSARNLCLMEGADLLSIASPEEQAYITGIIREERVTAFWTGLNDLYNEAGWEWSNGGPFSYLNWAEGEPDNAAGGEHCVVISTHNGEWSDKDCDLQFAHICKKLSLVATTPGPTTALPGGGCPRGWSGYGSHCYLIEKDMVEWNVAESYCHAIGAELASVHSIGEMQHLTAQLAEKRHSVYWFGANDLITENHWVFSNGTVGSPEEELDYFKWAEGEPNDAGSAGEDCATLVYSWNWEWNDYRCDATLPYVCQGVPNPEIGDDKYSVFRDPETFADAEEHCRAHGGTLATIANQEQMDQLSALLFQAYDPFEDDTFWFGLNDIKSEGNWVMGGDEDGTQVQQYTNWHWGEPNNSIFAGEDCVAMIPDDDYTWAWYDYGCDVAERFICEDIDPDAPMYGDHTYTVVDEALPWGKASEYCLKNGGQLARLRDQYLEGFVEYLLDRFEEDVVLRSKGVWIGLTDISHQDFFEWSDGSKVTYTNWNAGDPSNFARKEDCTFVFTSSGTDPNGQVYRMGRWGDYDCTGEDFGYICKKDKEVVPVTDVPPPQYNCPEGWLWTSNYCYFVTGSTMSWEDGQETCLKEDCNLATIGSYSELAQLQDRLSDLNGLFWIGLNDKERVGFYQWVDGSPVTFTNWDYNQPDNADGRCVGMAVGPEDYGEWDDQTCDSRYQAICQKIQDGAVFPDPPATPSPSGTCPPGWMGHGSYCYQIVRVGNISLAMSWEEARQDCMMRSSHEGSLVTLHNATVEDWLKQEAAKLTPPVDDREGFWIGLNDRGTDGYYYWTGYVDHNYVIEYVNWGDGQPDDKDHTQNCVQMFLGEDSGGWEDEDCALKRNWICEMPKLSDGLPTDMPTVNPSDSPLCGNASMWDFYEGSCYHTHGIHGQQEYKTWDNAEYVCQSLDAHLVSVHSPSENNLIRSVMLRDGFEKIWIGMRSVGGTGYQWSDGSAVDYVTWGPNQPDDRDGELACLVFSTSSGKWMHEECEEALPYMCKKTPGASGPPTPAITTQAPGNCRKGWFAWGNKCYQFFPELGNWDEARNICKSNDGDLATIRNRDEQLFLTTLLDDVSYGVWIGLSDVSAEGHFTWADGSPVTFTNWAHLEPNGGTMENCAEIRHSLSEFMPGSWNDATCDSRFGALCQTAKDPEETVPPPTLTACAEGYQFYENSCYKVITDQHAYEDAKYACQDRNVGQPVSLASVFDLYEQSYLELLVMRSELDEPVWLGLQYNQSSTKFEWLDGWPVYFTNWAMDEPSNGEGEGCVAFLPESGRWDNMPCDHKHSAICKYTFNLPPILPSVSTDDCPDEDWTPYGRYCFKAFIEDKDLLGQPSALYQCSQFEHTNLASIHSKEENDFISRFVDQGIYSIWIGLKNDNGGGFAWTDESAVEFVHWDDNEPSGSDEGGNAEECVEMFTSGGHIGKWNDIGCLTERPFVCKFTSPNFITPTDGGTDKHTGTTLPLGLIIGISIGAVLVLIIIFVGFILIRRQRRLISYFRSISGTGVSHANLYNEEDGVDDGENESSRDLRSGSFDDAMLRVN